MDVAAILLSAQSPDPNVRNNAEAVLHNARESDFSSFMQTLSSHLASDTADAESRRLAGLIMKNNLDAKDRTMRLACHAKWTQLDATTVKPAMRAHLMHALASPAPQPRRAAAQVISKIAAIELPTPGSWDNLVTDLLTSSTSAGSPDHLRQAALETLGYICEDAAYGNIPAEVLQAYSNQILTAVVHGMTYKAEEEFVGPPANGNGSEGPLAAPGAPAGRPNGAAAAVSGASATPNGSVNAPSPAVNGAMPITANGAVATDPEAAAKLSAADVRLAATIALNNAIEFARSQFDVENERMAIMKTVYSAAKSSDERIRQAAFECLAKIGENYYDKLPEYIRWLYELTEAAIRSDTEQVALQGIEFWSTIAEEEIALMDEAEASRELGVAPERTSQGFVATALPYLIPCIFSCLKQQEDDPLDDETWNRATAAGACLELLAQSAPDSILGLSVQFIETNIADTNDWRSREAAILAFGSVLEGPSIDAVKALVQRAFATLMNTLVTDHHVAVRDTTAWTLARVVQVDRDTTVEHLTSLVECLRVSLSNADNPVLAAHVCYAIHNLAECFLDDAENDTGPLRDHAEVLLRTLIYATTREDAGEGHLRTTAYEALNMMLRAVSRDCITFVQSCLPLLLEKLEATLPQLNSKLSEDDAMEIIEIQGLLCGSMTTATQRLAQTATGWEPFADRMMTAYLQVLSVSVSAAVHEEALLAIGAVADVANAGFQKYMQHLVAPLSAALSNHEHYQVCAVATAVVGDVCRSLGPQVMAYADSIVYLLLEALQSNTLDRSVKPPILSCFGDIALAAKGQFENYLPPVMARMQQAAEKSVQVEVAPDDYDMQDWLLLLRESIFEAYIGIINGLRDDNKQSLLVPYVKWLVGFCQVVVAPSSSTGGVGSDVIVKAAAGVLGDLVDALPTMKEDLQKEQWIRDLMERGMQSNDLRTRETATYAQQTIYGN